MANHVKSERTKTFKAPGGQFLTKALFFETSLSGERDNVLYTLKDDDHLGLPSIKRLFVEMEDETEYLFANTYFHSWNHYKRLLDVSWFSDVMKEAREELSLKLAARELVRVKQKAEQGDLRAAQYLLEKKWMPKEDTRGRPSKKKIEEEAKSMARDMSDIVDDFERIVGSNVK